MLFYFGRQPLHVPVFQHDNAKAHAARRTTQFFANDIVQNLPCLPCSQISFKPKWTHLGRVGQSCSKRVNAPETCVSCSRHSSKRGWPSKHEWFITWNSLCLTNAEQLLILENAPPTNLRVSQSQNTDWLNCFLDEKNVKNHELWTESIANEI